MGTKKEPSQRDDSFDQTKHLFKLINKIIFTFNSQNENYIVQ